MHRGVGTAEAYSRHCFAALMKERRENNSVRVEKIVEFQVMSVSKKLRQSAVVIHYCGGVSLLRFVLIFLKQM